MRITFTLLSVTRVPCAYCKRNSHKLQAKRNAKPRREKSQQGFLHQYSVFSHLR